MRNVNKNSAEVSSGPEQDINCDHTIWITVTLLQEMETGK